MGGWPGSEGASMKRLLLVAALLAGSTTLAHAQWMTNVEDDLFSDKKIATMVGYSTPTKSILVTCSDSSDVSLTYVEKGDSSAFSGRAPMQVGKMVIKPDNGQKWESTTSVFAQNPEFFGFSFDDTGALPGLIREIGHADSKVVFGLNLISSDIPIQWPIPAQGSTSAVKSFMEACGLE